MDDQPTLHDLAASIRLSDQQYLETVWALSEAQLGECIDFVFADGAAARMSREEMLITHGVGHRGQVSALMLLNGHAPARDGFTSCLHDVDARQAPSRLTA